MVRLLFGPGWEPTGHIFALLSISMFAATPMNTVGWVYMSLGQTRRMFKWGLIAIPFYMLSFLIGLPYGASGVALCYSMAVTIAFGSLPRLRRGDSPYRGQSIASSVISASNGRISGRRFGTLGANRN